MKEHLRRASIGRRAAVLGGATLALAGLAKPAASEDVGTIGDAKRTETRGKVVAEGQIRAQQRLESVGSYEFRGRTEPSREGQRVIFAYRRLRGDEWRRFHTDGHAFSTRRDRPIDRISRNDRWRIDFVPYRTGRFVLRARFPRQDGFGRSATREHVEVVGEGA